MRERLLDAEYASLLPEGVTLRREPHNHRYQLMLGNERLGRPRRDDEVLKWTKPAEVFRSIAEREIKRKG